MSTEPDNSNPFAPSLVVSQPDAVPVDDATQVWREGHWVLTSLDAELPQRCVFCNGEVTRRRRSRQYIVTLRGLKKTKLTYWVCGRHYLFGWLRNLVLVSVIGGLVISLFFGVFKDAFFYGIGMFAFPLYFIVLVCAPSLQLHYRRGNIRSIIGCGRRFLNSLPTKSEINSHR